MKELCVICITFIVICLIFAEVVIRCEMINAEKTHAKRKGGDTE